MSKAFSGKVKASLIRGFRQVFYCFNQTDFLILWSVPISNKRQYVMIDNLCKIISKTPNTNGNMDGTQVNRNGTRTENKSTRMENRKHEWNTSEHEWEHEWNTSEHEWDKGEHKWGMREHKWEMKEHEWEKRNIV